MSFERQLARMAKASAKVVKRQRPTVQGLSNQIKTIKRSTRKEPRVVIQTEIAGTLNDTPVIVHVDPSANGRHNSGIVLEGNSAKWMSVRIKGWFKSVGATNNVGRLDVLLDRSPVQGTIAPFTDIYSPGVEVPMVINNMLHPGNRKRFKILASFIACPTTGGAQTFFFDRFIRLNHVMYTEATTYTQANQYKNAILVAHWCDTAGGELTYSYTVQTICVDDN